MPYLQSNSSAISQELKTAMHRCDDDDV